MLKNNVEILKNLKFLVYFWRYKRVKVQIIFQYFVTEILKRKKRYLKANFYFNFVMQNRNDDRNVSSTFKKCIHPVEQWQFSKRNNGPSSHTGGRSSLPIASFCVLLLIGKYNCSPKKILIKYNFFCSMQTMYEKPRRITWHVVRPG